MRLRILGLSVVLIFLLSCASADIKQAKIYESDLGSMVEKDSEEVVTKITGFTEKDELVLVLDKGKLTIKALDIGKEKK